MQIVESYLLLYLLTYSAQVRVIQSVCMYVCTYCMSERAYDSCVDRQRRRLARSY